MDFILGVFYGAEAVHAATPTLLYFYDLVAWVKSVLGALVPVLIALALAIFIWGLVKFIFASGDEKVIEEGRSRMIWGVIALFVIVSVWGLVALINQLSGVDQGEGFSTPFVNFI